MLHVVLRQSQNAAMAAPQPSVQGVQAYSCRASGRSLLILFEQRRLSQGLVGSLGAQVSVREGLVEEDMHYYNNYALHKEEYNNK